MFFKILVQIIFEMYANYGSGFLQFEACGCFVAWFRFFIESSFADVQRMCGGKFLSYIAWSALFLRPS